MRTFSMYNFGVMILTAGLCVPVIESTDHTDTINQYLQHEILSMEKFSNTCRGLSAGTLKISSQLLTQLYKSQDVPVPRFYNATQTDVSSAVFDMEQQILDLAHDDEPKQSLKCDLVSTLLCTELSGGVHPLIQLHVDNRRLLDHIVTRGQSISYLSSNFLRHLIGLYDFHAVYKSLSSTPDQSNLNNQKAFKSCLSNELCDDSNVFKTTQSQGIAHLDRDGFFVFPHQLDHPVVERILDDLSDSKFVDRTNPEKNFIYGADAEKAGKYPWSSSSALWIFDQNAVMSIEDVQKVAFDPLILSIVQGYLGSTPILLKSDVWLTMPHHDTQQGPNDDSKSSEYRNATFTTYHADFNSIRGIKVFVMLSDVSHLTGPHTLYRASHKSLSTFSSQWELRRDIWHQNVSESDLQKMFSNDDLMELELPAGSIIIEDTACLHKGTPVIKGHRIMLQLDYGISGLGAKDRSGRLYTPLNRIPDGLKTLSELFPRLFQRMRIGRFDASSIDTTTFMKHLSDVAARVSGDDDIGKIEEILNGYHDQVCQVDYLKNGDNDDEFLTMVSEFELEEYSRQRQERHLTPFPTKTQSSSSLLSSSLHLNPNRNKFSWAFFVHGTEYSMAAVVVISSLINEFHTQYPITVLTYTDAIPTVYLKVLQDLDVNIRYINKQSYGFENAHQSDINENTTSSRLAKEKQWKRAHDKLQAMKMIEYSKVALMDVDFVIMRPIDFVFDIELQPGQIVVEVDATMDTMCDPILPKIDSFSTGLMVFEPNMTIFEIFVDYSKPVNDIFLNDQQVLQKMVSDGKIPKPIILQEPFKTMTFRCECAPSLDSTRAFGVAGFIGALIKKPWVDWIWRSYIGVPHTEPSPCDGPLYGDMLTTQKTCLRHIYCSWLRKYIHVVDTGIIPMLNSQIKSIAGSIKPGKFIARRRAKLMQRLDENCAYSFDSLELFLQPQIRSNAEIQSLLSSIEPICNLEKIQKTSGTCFCRILKYFQKNNS